uniref:Uncharacterized protein n=1 Tax=Leersia perrieri TaxID=77586 RepID=A0A0D9VM38_9ORYZ
MGIGLPWRIDRSVGFREEARRRRRWRPPRRTRRRRVPAFQAIYVGFVNALSRANRVSLSSSPPHARTQFCPNCLNLFHRSDPRRRRRRSFAGATTPDRGKVRIGSIDRLSSLCVVVASRSNSKQSNEEDPPFAGLLLALAFIIISVLLLLCSLPQAKIGGLGIGGGGCQCGWI